MKSKKGRRKLAPLGSRRRGGNSMSDIGGGIHNKQQHRIFDKKDLVEAVRRLSPGRRSHSTPALHSSRGAAGADEDDEAMSSTYGSTRHGAASGKRTSKAQTRRKPLQRQEEGDAGLSTLKALEAGVNLHARRYNELKVQAEQKQRDLERLLDQLHALELENKSLNEMKESKSAESARIVKLTEECNEIQRSMEKKQMYRAQLDHMAQRLQSNVMKFGSHIKTMEDQLHIAKREHKEVKLLLRQLEQGKTAAVKKLQDTIKTLEQDRKMRARELSQRQKEAENAKRLEDWRQDREQRRLELQAELRGDLSKEEEEELIEKLKKREGQSAKLRAASIDRNKKAMTLEDAFAQIRQATGVTSLNEMVDKFMGQGASKEALLEEKAEAERKLSEIMKAKKEAQAKFNEMKAQVAQTGIGGLELNREIYDKLDEEILGAKAELKLNRAANERLENVLVAVRQGAKGLSQRLEPFKDLLTYEEQAELPKTDIEALDLLIECEAKLLKMLERLDVDETGAVVPGSPTAQSPISSGKGLEQTSQVNDAAKKVQPWTPFDNDDPEMHEFNVRVPRARPTSLSRLLDAEEGDLAALSSDGAVDENTDDDDDDADMVPDRSLMKRTAKKRYTIAMSRRDMEKRLAMGEDDDGGGGSAKARKARASKRAQADRMRRLAGTGSPKKQESMAFLTQRPNLL